MAQETLDSGAVREVGRARKLLGDLPVEAAVGSMPAGRTVRDRQIGHRG